MMNPERIICSEHRNLSPQVDISFNFLSEAVPFVFSFSVSQFSQLLNHHLLCLPVFILIDKLSSAIDDTDHDLAASKYFEPNEISFLINKQTL